MPFDLLAYNPAPTPEMEHYGQYLLGRLHEAFVVPRAEVALPGWTPAPNDCHDNCQHYALNSGTGHRVASGWLVMDQREWLGHIRFFAHSVMAASEDPITWYDITPGDRLNIYPFLAGNLSAKDFMQFDHALARAYDASIFDVRT